MNFPLPHPALEAVLNRLADLPVDRVILYGSRARGDHGERSDIDIAIDAPQLDPTAFHRILDLFSQADTLLKIDAVHLQQVDESLAENIRRDGKILHDYTAS